MVSIFASGVDSFVQFIVALLMLVLVIVLCYFTTRFIANYQKGSTSKGNIEVLEAKGVGSNKMIEIVRIGEEYYAIGISKDNVTLIDKIDKSTLNLEKYEPVSVGESFSQILGKIKSKKEQKSQGDK